MRTSPLLIRDKPTAELVELESQLYAEIMAIALPATNVDALMGMALVHTLKTVRKILKRRAELQ